MIRNKSKFAFTTTSGYLVFYGVIRFFIEGLRKDSLYIGDTGLRLSQVTSVIMVIAGIALVIISRNRDWKRNTVPVGELLNQSKQPQEGMTSKDTTEAITSPEFVEDTPDVEDPKAADSPDSLDRSEAAKSSDDSETPENESVSDGDGADSDSVG
jgi:phosphatidylglycerol:prolipoprotein diacylglycerol transferase